jgi:hypothetical protein
VKTKARGARLTVARSKVGCLGCAGCAVRRRRELRRHAAETGHALPVVFVLNSAVHADLVGPMTCGISNRESELMLASEEQS